MSSPRRSRARWSAISIFPAARAGFREEPLRRRLQRCSAQHPDLIIAASGSSRHAGLAAEILLEDLAGLAVDVEYASEYACRSTHGATAPGASQPGAGAVAVGRDGGHAGGAARGARGAGIRRIAVTNVRGLDHGARGGRGAADLAGVELAIPATKSFTTQLALMAVLTLLAARERGALADG